MAATAPQPRSLRLALLADRDADTRMMYAEYLTRARCEVDHATDGREALAKAISRRPDAVVTDTRLPGIDGIDLCRLLRGDPATASIALVIVTGDAYAADVQRAEGAGADRVLIKPCLPETLLAELRRLVERPHGVARADPARGPGQGAADGRRSRQILDGRDSRAGILARAHQRRVTDAPPVEPPALLCPNCDHALTYMRSHIGGVNALHSEQWDYFECPSGCGTFQYRQRTRKLRKV
ncbi:MAG: response regulator [Betaproteobacteria bacterium]